MQPDALPSAAPPDAEAPAPEPAPALSLPALATLQPEDWIGLFEQLDLAGVVRSIASHTVLEGVLGDTLSLVLDEHNATLFNDEHRKQIEQALIRLYGNTLQLRMRVGTIIGETPAAFRRRRERELREAALRRFHEDPVVQGLVREFNARINTDSISPVSTGN